MVLMPGFQSTRLATEGALEPFFFLYTDDSIQGNPETCKQSSIMLNYEVKNMIKGLKPEISCRIARWIKRKEHYLCLLSSLSTAFVISFLIYGLLKVFII